MIKHDIKSYMTGATHGPGTAYPSEATEFTPIFSWVRVIRSLDFCVLFCRSLFVLFSFFWQLYCLTFELWLLIASVASSNFSDVS